MSTIILEGMLDMNMDACHSKLTIDGHDLWSVLGEYCLDGMKVKITIEKIK
ncbi:MAG TPA: hypothetical protein VGL27_03740 [Negativicutes bacterium]